MSFDDILSDRIKFGYTQIKILFLYFLSVFIEAQEIQYLGILNSIDKPDIDLTGVKFLWYQSFKFLLWGIGNILGGKSSDVHGRKSTANFGIIGIFLFSILSIMFIQTNIMYFLILRALYAFWVGFTQPSMQTLVIEIIPQEIRGKIMILFLGLAWPFGEGFCLLSAYFSMDKLFTGEKNDIGEIQRLLVCLEVPILLMGLGIISCVYESPRYNLVKQEYEMGLLTISKMLKDNKKEDIAQFEKEQLKNYYNNTLNRSSHLEIQPHESEYKLLFHPQIRHLTIKISFLWFSLSIVYYGIILTLPYVMEHINLMMKIKTLVQRNYSFLDLGYSILIELVAVFIGYNIIDKPFTGRKMSTTIAFIVSTVFTFGIYFLQSWMFTYFVVILKFSSELCFILVYIYNSELFFTQLRSTAIGFCTCFSRIAAFLLPFIAFLCHDIDVFLPFLLMGILSLIAVIESNSIQIDTQGKDLDNEDILNISNLSSEKHYPHYNILSQNDFLETEEQQLQQQTKEGIQSKNEIIQERINDDQDNLDE